MVRKGNSVERIAFGKLGSYRFRIHPYAHRRNLERATEHVVIEHYVSVKRPVVVIGRSAVVFFAVAHFAAYLHYEHGFLFLRYCVFTFLNAHSGIPFKQFLRRDKIHVSADSERDGRINRVERFFGIGNRTHDFNHRFFEKFRVSVRSRNYFFPIPLVHEHRMQIIDVIVAAYGVHIGINSLSGFVTVFAERGAFPFRKALYDFRVHSGNFLYGESDFSFHAVEVVVYSACFGHEKGSGYSVEIKRGGKFFLKSIFYEFYRFLRFSLRKRGFITFGNQ